MKVMLIMIKTKEKRNKINFLVSLLVSYLVSYLNIN